MGAFRAVWVWVAIMLVGGRVLAAELFVGADADYATLQAAVDAAAPGDTITIRGGYATPGALVDRSLTIRGEFNWQVPANDPAAMTQPNPARGAESVVTSPIRLRYAPSASGTRLLGLFLDLDSPTGGASSAIHFPDHNSGRVTDITIRNNRFRCTGTTAVNGWIGIGGGFMPYADRVLVADNRMGTIIRDNTSAIFVQGRDWTIINNYINHNADGGRISENGRRGFNIWGPDGASSDNLVIAGNLFKDFGGVEGNNWVLQPNGRVSNLLVAHNRFDGSSRDLAFYPAGTNFLIAANSSTNLVVGTTGVGGFSLDLLPGANSFAAGNAMYNLVVRHNLCDVDVGPGDDRAFRWALIRPFSNAAAGSILIERNAVTVRGTAGATALARGAVRIGAGANQDRMDRVGPVTIRDNHFDASGYAAGADAVPAIGVFVAGTDGGRETGGMDLLVANNRMTGFEAGAYVGMAFTGTQPGALPADDDYRFHHNNSIANALGVHGGASGAGIDISGSYFEGNVTNMAGVVTGTPGGAINPVAGRDPDYVVFRGDFNLDNVVDEADRLVWRDHVGQSGPGVTYFHGDAGLDQAVSAADLLVWKRYVGVDINAPAPSPAPAVPPGVPRVQYDAYTGMLRLAGRGSDAWAILLQDGDAALQVLEADTGALGGDWVQAAFGDDGQSGRIEFIDATAGNEPLPAASVAVARLQPGLVESDFGPVTYYTGTGVFQTGITWKAGGGMLFMLE